MNPRKIPDQFEWSLEFYSVADMRPKPEDFVTEKSRQTVEEIKRRAGVS